MTGSRGERIAGIVGVVVLLVVYGIPSVWLVATSLKTDVAVVNQAASLVFDPTLVAYRRVGDARVALAMWNSFQIGLGTTLIVMFVGLPCAYALARMRRWRAMILLALIALQTVPHASFVIPMFPVLEQWGQLGTLRGVIIALSALFLPFTVLLLRPFFVAVPLHMEEAAEIDGAGPIRLFWSVVLPNVRNGALTIGVITFINAWGEFTFSITLLSDPQLYPLSALLSQQIGRYGVEWNNLMALAVIAALPTIALFSMVAGQLRSGLSMGSGK